MYKRILNCSSVGMVQQQLIHYLNDKKHFCANLPLATCTVIHMGISLLACYHLAATSMMAIQVSGEDVVVMHLWSMEASAWMRPMFWRQQKWWFLGKTAGSLWWDNLRSHFWQEVGPATGDGQMDHSHNKIWSVISEYAEFATLFILQLAWFIDCKVQLYLGSCIEAELPEDVSSAYLSFTKAKKDIMEGSFINNLVPQSLTWQLCLKSNRHTGASLDNSSSDEDALQPSCKQRQQKGWGQKVINDNLIEK